MHLSYSNMDYLGCKDCDRFVSINEDNGECHNLKEGCKKLLAMLKS
jgi:hypothetical protein